MVRLMSRARGVLQAALTVSFRAALDDPIWTPAHLARCWSPPVADAAGAPGGLGGMGTRPAFAASAAMRTSFGRWQAGGVSRLRDASTR